MHFSPLIYAKNISSYYNKNIWLKLEILNPTGSHKDRESLALLKEARRKKIKHIGCASTGNLAISLAFFSKIYKIKSHIWLRKQDINLENVNLIKSLGATLNVKKTNNLSEIYKLSSTLMKNNKIFDANPNKSRIKLLANKKIVEEVYKQEKKIDTFVSCINNGSHLIGLKLGIKKKHRVYGVYSKNKFASSINSFSKYEKNLWKYFNFNSDFLEAKEKQIKLGYKLLKTEGLTCEPAAAGIIGSINKINANNICCIISGSIHKNIKQLQFINLQLT